MLRLRTFAEYNYPHQPNRVEELLVKLPEVHLLHNLTNVEHWFYVAFFQQVQEAAGLLLESKMYYVPFLLNSNITSPRAETEDKTVPFLLSRQTESDILNSHRSVPSESDILQFMQACQSENEPKPPEPAFISLPEDDLLQQQRSSNPNNSHSDCHETDELSKFMNNLTLKYGPKAVTLVSKFLSKFMKVTSSPGPSQAPLPRDLKRPSNVIANAPAATEGGEKKKAKLEATIQARVEMTMSAKITEVMLTDHKRAETSPKEETNKSIKDLKIFQAENSVCTDHEYKEKNLKTTGGTEADKEQGKRTSEYQQANLGLDSNYRDQGDLPKEANLSTCSVQRPVSKYPVQTLEEQIGPSLGRDDEDRDKKEEQRARSRENLRKHREKKRRKEEEDRKRMDELKKINLEIVQRNAINQQVR